MRYALLILLAACSEKRGGTTMEDVKRDAHQAMQTTAAFVTDTAAQTKEDYLTLANQKLTDIDQRIAALKRDLASKNAEAKKQSEAQLKALDDTRTNLAAEIAQVKADSSDSWRQTRAKADATLDAFEKSYSDLRQRLSRI